MNNAGSRAECQRGLLEPVLQWSASLIFRHAWRGHLRRKWQVVRCTHRAPDKFNVASESVRCQIHRVFDQKPARVHIRALPRIQSVGKSDCVDLIIRRRPKENARLNLGVGDFHMTHGDGQACLVIFRDFTIQLESSTQFEFRVAIVSESERGKPGSEEKIRIEEERIFIQDFALVAAL